MCDCIKIIEEKVQVKFMEEVNRYNGVVTEDVEIQHKGYSFDDLGVTLFVPVIGKYNRGKSSRKYETAIHFNYCPFCGEKKTKPHS